MISVLCPSRGRPTMLADSLRSLRAHAYGPIELLVAADPDDGATMRTAQTLGVRWWMAEERYGYERLHEYYNALAKIAQGAWLLLWNDDALMAHPGWDEAIGMQAESVVWTIDGYRFPAVPKRWVDHLGHFSLEWHNDSWWEQIGRRLGMTTKLGLQGSHDNPKDETSRDAVRHNPGFYGEENMALIAADVAKLREIL